MLEIQNITCVQGKKTLLNDFSCFANRGELTAVLGINGSGKSSLLRCIDRFYPLQKGRILLDDIDLSCLKVSELAKKVSYIPQQISFRDDTVLDAVLSGVGSRMGFFGGQKYLSEAEKIAEELDLTALLLQKVDRLSGGERQKTALARALMQNTPLMLLDEPTSDLDLKNAVETMTFLRKKAHAENKTILTVLHDINLAFRFCDRFILVKEGKCLAQGDKNEITCDQLGELYNLSLIPCRQGNTLFFTEQTYD